jgi:hypothetical protein
MKTIALKIDAKYAGRSQAGLVWARLYLDFGDRAFPDPQWTDFVVVVLTWWVNALTALLRGTSQRQEVMFMEGPFTVVIDVTASGAWRLTCVERGLRRVTREQGAIEPKELLSSAASCADMALALCQANGWWSSDAEALESGLRELKKEVALRIN